MPCAMSRSDTGCSRPASRPLKPRRKNYEAQETRFRAGLVSTHDILDYQEKLARAEVNYARQRHRL